VCRGLALEMFAKPPMLLRVMLPVGLTRPLLSMARTVSCAALSPNSMWGSKTNYTAPPMPLEVTSV